MFSRQFWRAFANRSRFRLHQYALSAPYVLIGGGTASYFASLAIRARDSDAKVLIIGDETETPYQRIALSKEFWWYGDSTTSNTLSYKHPQSQRIKHSCYETDGFYLTPDKMDEWPHGAVALLRNTRVVKIDPAAHTIYLADGRTVQFEKCLIATGSKPQLADEFQTALTFTDHGRSDPSCSGSNTADDYRRLEKSIRERIDLAQRAKAHTPKVVIVGGGVLGTELAYSLNRRFVRRLLVNGEAAQIEVVQLVPESNYILSEMLPSTLSKHATDELISQGVKIVGGSWINSGRAMLKQEGEQKLSKDEQHHGSSSTTRDFLPPQLELSLASSSAISDGDGDQGTSSRMLCDFLVFAAGADPQVDVALASGIPLDERNGGIYTDKFLRVGDLDVWAAGDVASFFDPAVRRRRRETHWEHAQATGRQAGENMTGGQRTYDHQAAFVSLVSPNVHISGVGVVDARALETVTFFVNDEDDGLLLSMADDTKLGGDSAAAAAVVSSGDNASAHALDEKTNLLPEKRGAGKILAKSSGAMSEKECRAVVFYIDPRTKRLVGVLAYNVFGQGLELSRKLVRDAGVHTPEELAEVVKLFDLFGVLEDGDEALTSAEFESERKQQNVGLD